MSFVTTGKSTVPGSTIAAIQIPISADAIVVNIKYEIVRSAIFPFIRAFKLAETFTKLEISNGNVNNFKIRKNSSPGYEISIIVSSEKLYCRKNVPMKMKNSDILFQKKRV